MPRQPSARVEHLRRLPAPDLQSVSALVDAATETDAVHPLSERTVLDLVSGREGGAWHLLVFVRDGEDEVVAGYAHLDPANAGGPGEASAELVVHPAYRRRGVGRLLARDLERLAGRARLTLWAHGQLPASGALARSLGYTVGRELWQLRRSLTQRLPEAAVPPGLTVRSFRPGQDDDAWVATNAAAFAHHPEQGRWTVEDLRLRMAEPWFDPEGFLVLHDVQDAPSGPDASGPMAGFHWTKVHPAEGTQPALGEVYVVGVSPVYQGRGLGRVLTIAGLEHLRSKGLTEAMLYVDAGNEAAVRTYSRLGFSQHSVDVQYRRLP